MKKILSIKNLKYLYIIILSIIAICTTFLNLCSCSKNNNGIITEEQDVPENKNIKILSQMTLEEKIGQLFITTPEKLSPNKDGITSINDEIINNIKKYNIGGIIFFGKNIKDENQVKSFINDLQNSSKYKLFISVDEEGGLVSRIANCKGFKVKKYSSIMNIGKTNNESNAESLGFTIGSYLKPLGFNLNFAPVADINTNPKNPVIGSRSYGNNANLVSKMVNAQLDGMHRAGIMGCIKHYPGHGDTSSDTHTGSVKINKTWEQLKQCEIIPFESSFNKTDMIMASHIIANNISHDNLPTSLSKHMIQDKLRNELGYKGVIISDSMEMKAIADHYNSARSSVLAIKAGVDIILLPPNIENAFNAVLQAVNNSEISIERINESVLKILDLKSKY